MAYLHSQGVCHLALHPRNVLLNSAMAIKLSDFGRTPKLTTALLEGNESAPSHHGDKKQEPARLYMAPEVVRLESFEKSADIWSLGCLLAHMGSQKPLYSGSGARSTYIIMVRVSTGEIKAGTQLEKVEGISPLLIDLVHGCTNLEAAERPTAAGPPSCTVVLLQRKGISATSCPVVRGGFST